VNVQIVKSKTRLEERTPLLLAFLCAILTVILPLSLTGCATVAEVGANIGQAAGAITPEQAESMKKTGQAFGKALEQITPEQEYYVGRAVGATIASQYKIWDNDAATRYINVVGQALAMASDKPETFGGYHFLIMDSDEINAFAAPGGFIFVSRGMLKLCKSEDDLAAVLAHEIAHVQLGHAIGAISNSRWTQAFTILGTESAKSFGGEQLAQLTEAFEGSINDITTTLMTSGYARKQEKQADEVAITILTRVGYDPKALPRVLTAMEPKMHQGGPGFASTHPPPETRIEDLNRIVAGKPSPASNTARAKRFATAMRGV
jgi:predicted Zn-dependent protease